MSPERNSIDDGLLGMRLSSFILALMFLRVGRISGTIVCIMWSVMFELSMILFRRLDLCNPENRDRTKRFVIMTGVFMFVSLATSLIVLWTVTQNSSPRRSPPSKFIGPEESSL
jgi:hypothetical protein